MVDHEAANIEYIIIKYYKLLSSFDSLFKVLCSN
jgi:hypothetical protein